MPLNRHLVALISPVLIAAGFVAPAKADGPPGVITEFPIPAGDAQGIAVDDGGNAWTAMLGTGKIVRRSPSGVITEFSPPTADSSPRGITIGPDGNVWFTQGNVNKIGRITPSGTITEFALNTPGSALAITAGPDGNLWYLSSNNNNVNRLSTAGQVTGSFPIPTPNSAPVGITAGPDGNVWFTEFFGNKIGRVTPSGVINEFVPPTASSSPRGIGAGPDGNVWFTESANSANKIGRITPSGTITEFPIPTANSFPVGITAGPDGNVWFAQGSGNKVARMTPGGTITEYPLPNPSSSPREITTGPDGSVWFIENFGGRIGRITSGVSPEDRRPTLNGTGQSGLPLVCGADVWGLTSTVTIGWQRNGSVIPGQTGLAYTPTDAEIGSSITCSSTGRLPGVVALLRATSNPVTVVAQLTGPVGPRGIDGQLSAVFAPGVAKVRAGKSLKVRFGITNAAALTAQLKGKKTLTKAVRAKAGTNTLKMKVPKSLKPGRYSLRLLSEGASLASTKVKVTR